MSLKKTPCVFENKNILGYMEGIKIESENVLKKPNPFKDIKLLTLSDIEKIDITRSDMFGQTIKLTLKDEEYIYIHLDTLYKKCKGVGKDYFISAFLSALYNENYDILLAVSYSKQQLLYILGFLITQKGECQLYDNIHAVNLVCSSMPGLGSLLVGAYLYCVSFIEGHNVGLLELMDSFNNPSGFFSYSKMGFDIAYTLQVFGCFTQEECMPMLAVIDEDTPTNVIKRLLATNFIPGIGMSSCDFFVKNYGLPKKDDYLEKAKSWLEKYDKKFKSLKAKFKIRKALIYTLSKGNKRKVLFENIKNEVKFRDEGFEDIKAFKALYELSLPGSEKLIKHNEDTSHADKKPKFNWVEKKSRATRKGSPVARKGSRATRKGSRATRKGSRVAQKRSPVARKRSPVARKGSRATRKNN